MSDELLAEIMRLYDGLDTLSYYEFLDLRPGCDYVAVRDGFYARAQRFHPDQFIYRGGESLRQAVYAVFKRMTEAYNVLLDPELRLLYDVALQRGETRLSEVARARRLTSEERKVHNPFARIYLRSARRKLEQGAVRGAWVDARLGLSLEQAEPLRRLLTEIEAHPASPGPTTRGRR
ncbi:MAG: DnaJ domain-containing protein [Myxococcales bacterium]|nr:DnaJ domain-containing protein [Myxococcales bacterium]